ncbi:MAG: EAL domain-containing protein [Oscillatoria sp. PMC 1068.18]|nr:EAL domain-containing protein [Oscillatoria sp. PMC 1068.18]
MLSKTPLRLILIVPFVAQITAAVGLTAWLSIRNGQKAVHDVAIQLLDEVSTLTRDRIPTYLETPRQLNALRINDLELGYIDIEGDLRNLSPYLVRSLQTFESISFTVFANPQGDYIGARREADGSLQIGAIDEATQGNLRYYRTNEQGDFLELLQDIDLQPGDVLKRPWYKTAVEAEMPTWSEVYTTRSNESLAITAARPVYGDRGEVLGVFSTTITLKQIDQFLKSIKIGQSGQIFIVDGEGRLIATSTGERLYQSVNRDGVESKKLLQVTESQNRLTRTTAEALLKQIGHFSSVDKAQNFELVGDWAKPSVLMGDRQRKFVKVTSLPEDIDLDWHIVVVAPEADFMAQIYANTRQTIWLCLGALALITGSSILTARWITKPLLRLNQVAKEITQHSFESRSLPEDLATNRTREVSELSYSFEQMTQQLQASFAALQTSEANFRNVAANVPGAIFRYVLYADGTDAVLYMSPGCYQLWEIPSSVVEQDPSVLWGMIDPADLPTMQASVIKSAQTLENWNQKWRITTPSGRRKWLQGIGQPVRQPDESVLWHSVILDISDRQQTELALEKELLLSQTLFKTSIDGIVLLDSQGDVLQTSASFAKMLGYTIPETYRLNVTDWDAQWSREELQNILKGKMPLPPYFETRHRRKDGSSYDVEISYNQEVLNGETVHFCMCRDISDRKLAESERTRLINVLEASLNEIYLFNPDTLQFEYVNQGALQNLGYSLKQLQEMTPLDIKPEISVAEFEGLLAPLREGKTPKINFETVHQRANGSYYPVEVHLQLSQHDGQSVFLAIVLDISDRKLAEAQLIHQALHDSLTDLPNRTMLTSRLESAIQRAKRSRTYHFAVLFLDLDRFKVINDSLGHLVGDELLITVAQKLQNIIRATDLAARLGGDEFVILLEHIPNIQAVIHMAERLLTAFKNATVIDDHKVFVSTSIGIVWGTDAYTEASDLLRDADIALYRAKAKGHGKYEIFDVEMHVQTVKRMTLEQDLRMAIERQELIPYYQPIVDLKTLRIKGFEALIRWQHPSRGFVSPVDFIPVAEETGLILPISQWILQAACEQVAIWQQEFPHTADLRISVNLSSQDLRQPSLVQIVQQILQKSQLAPTSLTLEITESMLIENIEATITLLSQLREIGIRISIDDFGTGYSSLSYLYNLPANYLKIDQSFVSNMQMGDRNYKIVQAILGLSDQLELAAIAEGIETESQLDWLKKLGCELGQGYFFSRPLPEKAVESLLSRGQTIDS